MLSRLFQGIHRPAFGDGDPRNVPRARIVDNDELATHILVGTGNEHAGGLGARRTHRDIGGRGAQLDLGVDRVGIEDLTVGCVVEAETVVTAVGGSG